MATSAELAALTAAVAGNEWFKNNRRAICRNGALARVLEAPSAVTWRLVPNGTTIRPLPKSVADHPERVEKLFKGVHSWADQRGVALCVDEDAALTAEPMGWTPEELGALFARLYNQVFSSSPLAALLADFLDLAAPSAAASPSARGVVETNGDHREAIAPHVVHTLRAALRNTARLAPSECVERILRHVPRTALFPLPTSVEHRQVLLALADCDAAPEMEILPVRGAWVSDATPPPELSTQHVEAFLRALEPLIRDTDADSPAQADRAAQAATAALEFLRTGGGTSALASDGRFADIKVLRGREPRTRKVMALSIREFADRSRQGLLFRVSPKANEWLPLLVAAAPDAKPVIIDDRKAAEYLKEAGERDGSGPILREANKNTVLAIITRAARFGEKSSRAELLKRLNPGVDDDRDALRRLCAGDPAAGAESAELRVLSEASKGIERIVKEVFGRRSNQFLLPSRIADGLTPDLRRHLGIDVLDEPRIEALLENDLDTISYLQPTESEREAFLLSNLSGSLLRHLPIHVRSDGTVGTADGIYREADWAIPAALQQEVVTVQPCRDPKAQERQNKLIAPWSPRAQVETALRGTRPHVLWKEILEALDKLPAPSGECALVTRLRKTRWLAVDDAPVRPEDVLALPPRVSEHARALLTTGAFVPEDALPGDVQWHPGFPYVKEHLLPDEDASLAALARMIDDTGPEGLVGTISSEHAELLQDLVVLAKNGANLASLGWPLLAAVLASLDPTRETVRQVVSSFRPMAEAHHETAARHLDALAALAADRATEPEGKAARRVYEHGFAAIAEWPDDASRNVFGGTRVPTADGGWRTGREVVEELNGIALTHVLDPNLARTPRQPGKAATSGTQNARPTSSTDPNDGSSRPLPVVPKEERFIGVDLNELEEESAKETRRFLNPWKGRVPADLVIVYLGLVGRYPAMQQVAEEWRTEDATADVDTLWDNLDERMKPTQDGIGGPNPLRKKIEGRRFRINLVEGDCVMAIALSGDEFKAPLNDDASRLIVGNAHKRGQGIRSTDNGQEKKMTLYRLSVRQIDPGGLSSDNPCGVFRQLVETVATDCHHLFMSDASRELGEILDKATLIDQATLEDTKELLRDRLPTILAEIQLPASSACRQALQKYQRKEGRIGRRREPSDRPKDLDSLKTDLWTRIDNAEATGELLSSARDRIEDLGYSADRVLFELFQNADDAYEQLDDCPKAAFRVEALKDSPGVRVAHWGRLINQLGANADDGYRLGRDRDLLNMLVMNFSEKPAEGDLTGKFGLGVCAAGNYDHHMLRKRRRLTATYCARSDQKPFCGADS